MQTPAGVQIATLTRLWKATQSLERIRTAAEPAGLTRSHRSPVATSPSMVEDPPLWGAYQFRILDVRSPQRFAARHVPESGSLPADEIVARIHELPPRWRELVVVSEDPDEATAVTRMLRERGWLGAVPLIEPLSAWPGPWESGAAHRLLWEPSPLVRRWASRIPRGRIADLGCGSGRDAVYLARHGFEVVAIDRLPDALAIACRLAERMRAKLQTLQQDLRREPPAVAQPLAAVLMIRFHRPELFAWARAALAPGGLFLLETFAKQVEDPGATLAAHSVSEAPAAPRSALDPREVLAAFSDSHAERAP